MRSRVKDIMPRILVVEDNEGLARVLRLSLRAAGFDTTEVSTGRDALDVLAQNSPDAAVVDLQLPDGQGGAVLERLRQLDEQTGRSLVWVVISALDSGEATNRYGPLGTHFLAKPFDPWDLVAMLENLLCKRIGKDPRPQDSPPATGDDARSATGSLAEKQRFDHKPFCPDQDPT
jgi:two-component system OmpR family response regulator